MDLQCFLCWKAALLLLLLPCRLWCMLVHITNKQPVHVIPGSRLDLKAWIKTEPQEEISMVTWEREPETGFDPVMVTLATCSGSSMKCAGTRPNVRVNMEQQETTLQINGYSRADSGEYSVIVTDRTGANTTARCIVREYEAVHHVSVSINVSHSSLVCGEAWGTDPSFSWLHERAVITQTVGRVSRDGTTLFVTMSPICGHFTCVVSNKLGHSSDTYAANQTSVRNKLLTLSGHSAAPEMKRITFKAPCKSEGRGMTAAVVCLVLLLLLCGGVLAFLLWRRHKHNNRGERLHEYLDESL